LTLEEASRQQALDLHNKFRSELANGKTQNKTGYMPKGKTIKQMYYSMELEKEAQDWADKCKIGHSYAYHPESFYAFIQKYNESKCFYTIK
jgi:hypothetical protein